MLKHVASSSSGRLRRRSEEMGSTGTLMSSSADSSPTSSLLGHPVAARKPPVKSDVLRVFTADVKRDSSYKSFVVTTETTAKELVHMALGKCKMKHRDPNLFYLAMEVTLKATGVPVRTVIGVDDEAKPLVLRNCQPTGESRFHLQMRKGGLVKVHVPCLSPGVEYKSVYISPTTTAEQLTSLLLQCFRNSNVALLHQTSHDFSFHEVWTKSEDGRISANQFPLYERQLSPDDCPLLVQQSWPATAEIAFHLRKSQPFVRNRRPKRSANFRWQRHANSGHQQQSRIPEPPPHQSLHASCVFV